LKCSVMFDARYLSSNCRESIHFLDIFLSIHNYVHIRIHTHNYTGLITMEELLVEENGNRRFIRSRHFTRSAYVIDCVRCVAACCSVLHFIATCCSVLFCVAVHCSVLQCVAVCCSVLQCVAVCCSVVQCIQTIAVVALRCGVPDAVTTSLTCLP